MKLERLLVPVDYSEPSRLALRQAAFLAERFGATLTVMHVWERPTTFPETQLDGKELGDVVRENSDAELVEFVGSAALTASVPVETRVVPGEPVDTICRVAADGFDMVVLGTHGRTGISRLLLGSVAERVVRACAVPVLSVRVSEPAAE